MTRSALRRAQDCGDVESVIRAAALDRANAALDNTLTALEQAPPSWCNNPGGFAGSGAAVPIPPPPSVMPGAAPVMSPPQAAPGAPPTGTASPMTASSTNNQTAGVDEADFIKNEDGYVYAALNGALRIVDAWPAKDAREIARVALPGVPRKLLVNGDRVLVYVATAPQGQSSGLTRAGHTECTYGYDCQFGGDGTSTSVLIYDVSRRSQPRLVRQLDLNGSLIAARRIGSAVHTVFVTPEVTIPGIMTSVPIGPCASESDRERARVQLEALRDYNKRIIEETQLPDLVPSIKEDDRELADQSCAAVYTETRTTGLAFTTVMSLDMLADEPPSSATIVSKAGAVYASQEALYLAVPALESGPVPFGVFSQPSAADMRSSLYKFRIGDDPQDTSYLAGGTIKGHVLGQFSMDEYDGHLRVATTSGRVPMPDVHSTMSVLKQDGDDLELVGSVDDIAPSEDIRSVRFEGERGFVVTFKKTDPLYVFDLSKPKKPRIAGELKIPGFSTYMHMMDATHLLTIGYDADDQGSFAFFDGVMLQIFDVSDLGDPKLAHKLVIGTRGSSSEALTNHLAFTLFGDKLALPMTVCEGGGDGTFGTEVSFSGLLIYDVDLERGITERGRVAHPDVASGTYLVNCQNWWTMGASAVQRSIFMEDFVYSIATDVMRIQDVNALGQDVATVPLAP